VCIPWFFFPGRVVPDNFSRPQAVQKTTQINPDKSRKKL